jgi:RNA polymerase sigma-70 factor (ECF subfamily)
MSVTALPAPAVSTACRRGASRNFPLPRAFDAMSAPVNPEEDADVQLMLAVQRGEMAAFRELFDKHVAGAIGFATQFVGSRARAEELIQDVFLQLYRTRSRYAPRARFKTWLYRMVTNACLSEMRRADYRAGRDAHPPPGESTDPRGCAPEATARSTEDAVLGQEALRRMQIVLDALPPTQRAALLLVRAEGFSYDDVAKTLSCSLPAVKSLVHRATVSLRERLKDEA